MRRGYAVLGALLIASAVSGMLLAGYDARTADLGREEQALCRLKARLAAESSVALMQAALAQGGAARASENVAVERAGSEWSVRARGECRLRRGRTIAVVVSARLDRTGKTTAWVEGPP